MCMNNSKEIGTILGELRKQKNISQIEMAAILSERGYPVTNQAVCKWEIGLTSPNAPQFLELCDILGVEDILSTFSNGRSGYLAGLNRVGRDCVDAYIRLLKESRSFTISEDEDTARRILPVYNIDALAKPQLMFEPGAYESVEVNDRIPFAANIGIRMDGHSMEPVIHDKQIVWLRLQSEIALGETGVFLYDGTIYVRQYRLKNQGIALHALNDQYTDIIVSSAVPLKILAKVL